MNLEEKPVSDGKKKIMMAVGMQGEMNSREIEEGMQMKGAAPTPCSTRVTNEGWQFREGVHYSAWHRKVSNIC